MNPEDVDVLALRVRRMSPPLASDPERFHPQRSVIAHDLAELARRIAPRARRTSELEVEFLGKEAWPDRRRCAEHQRAKPRHRAAR